MFLYNVICILCLDRDVFKVFDSFNELGLSKKNFNEPNSNLLTYSITNNELISKDLKLVPHNSSIYVTEFFNAEEVVSFIDEEVKAGHSLAGLYEKTIFYKDEEVKVGDLVFVTDNSKIVTRDCSFVIEVIKIRKNWLSSTLFGKFKVKVLIPNMEVMNIKTLTRIKIYLNGRHIDYLDHYLLKRVNHYYLTKFK